MRAAMTMCFAVFVAVIGAVAVCGQPAGPPTKPATIPTVDPNEDPRPGLAAFFDAIRKADEPAAFNCWFADIRNDEDRKSVEDLVHHLIREMIGTAKFEAALRSKFPADFEGIRRSGSTTPDAAQLLGCKFTTYRRLAICRWADDEDAGFPMVLDNHERIQNKHGVWKVSMQQWYETNRSSVGDSMLSSGWGVKAKELITKEMLAGKFKNVDEMQTAYLKHMKEISDSAKE